MTHATQQFDERQAQQKNHSKLSQECYLHSHLLPLLLSFQLNCFTKSACLHCPALSHDLCSCFTILTILFLMTQLMHFLLLACLLACLCTCMLLTNQPNFWLAPVACHVHVGVGQKECNVRSVTISIIHQSIMHIEEKTAHLFSCLIFPFILVGKIIFLVVIDLSFLFPCLATFCFVFSPTYNKNK